MPLKNKNLKKYIKNVILEQLMQSNMTRAGDAQYEDMVVTVFEKMILHSCDAEMMTDGVVTGGRDSQF